MPGVIPATDDVLDALLELDLGGAPVFDDVPATNRRPKAFVIVGHDGDADSIELEAGTAALERAVFEDDPRDEVGGVLLALIATTGQSKNDLKAARAASRVLLVALADALGADPTLGGVVSSAWLSGVVLFQGRNSDGAFTRRVVTLSYERTT